MTTSIIRRNWRNSKLNYLFFLFCAVWWQVDRLPAEEVPLDVTQLDVSESSVLGGESSISLTPDMNVLAKADARGPLFPSRQHKVSEKHDYASNANAAPSPELPESSSTGYQPGDRIAALPNPLRETAEPPQPLSRRQLVLQQRIEQVLNYYRQRHLNTLEHSPWEVMHGILAQGIDAKLRIGGPHGEAVTAIGWLCFNRPTRNKVLFQPTRQGFVTLQGPGLEGHSGQLLAMLAQVKLERDYPIRVGGQEFTVADLITYEQQTCRARTELTFKLLALNHYLPVDATWRDNRGEKWSVARLVREELGQPIRGATCGGTHRLSAISLAVQKQTSSGEPLSGVFLEANRFIEGYQRYAFRLQNRDGSFSTNWFRGRENRHDSARKLRTTGHVLEWLLYSLSEDHLHSPALEKSVDFLSQLMWNERAHKWDAGPLGHAIHALRLYDERVLAGGDSQGDEGIRAAARP